ncbi:hypothetical protein [Methylobacterium sp. GC_Met_1]|uniref:hypothetical protein n=1 Tax=Methylobacterium sp. GC_Met_1 TaxID=2937377 RepID=UPI00226A198D|nr:hypothetical protein [Methylobacterium sp. GC_Met_1]
MSALTQARVLTLPAASAYPVGHTLVIADEAGACSTSLTVTLAPAGSDKINGAASVVLSVPWFAVVLRVDGASRWVAAGRGIALAADASAATVIPSNVGSPQTLASAVAGAALAAQIDADGLSTMAQASQFSIRTALGVPEDPDFVKRYGAKGDGNKDNLAAWNNAMAELGGTSFLQKTLRVPSGVFAASNTLNWTLTKAALRGCGRNTIFLGGSATADVMAIANGSGEANQILFEDFLIDAAVKQTTSGAATAGPAGLRATKLTRSAIRNVIFAGQDRAQVNNFLYNGLVINQCDQVWLRDPEICAQADGLLAYGPSALGGGPQANLFVHTPRILLCGANGVHIAGGLGGTTIIGGDVASNNLNLLVDNALCPSNSSREIYIHGTYFDAATQENIKINDPGLQVLVMTGGWACSSVNSVNINVAAMNGFFAFFGMCKGAKSHGIQIGTATIGYVIGGAIQNNGGYGVYTATNITPNYPACRIDPGTIMGGNTSGNSNLVPLGFVTSPGAGAIALQAQGPSGTDLWMDLSPTGGRFALNGSTAFRAASGVTQPPGGAAAAPTQTDGYLRIYLPTLGVEALVPVIFARN